MKILLGLGTISLLILLYFIMSNRVKQESSLKNLLKAFETHPDPNMARLEKYIEKNGDLFRDESKFELEKELLESAVPKLTIKIKDEGD